MKKIILLVSLSLVLMSCLDNSNNNTVVAEKVEWEDATLEQKQLWLEAYLKTPDDEGYALIDEIDTQLRSRFNSPNSVDYNFNDRPTFVKAVIPDADSGLVVINGSGTAENGFGAEIPFTYNVQLEINPGVKRIKEINISQ